MTNEVRYHTPAWQFQVWASFLIATGTMTVGIACLPVDPWMRGFLVMGLLFVVGSCFSLAKTTRDNHESKKLINRLSEAKAEQIIREYELGHESRSATHAYSSATQSAGYPAV